MEKKLTIGAIVLTAIALVIVVGATSPTGNAIANPAQCGGNCGNENCAAAQGGACNCESCPYLSCETGSCGGDCSNQECGAKVGGSCGCSK
jgi:hypothetical protein